MTQVSPRSLRARHRLIRNHLVVWIRCCHNAAPDMPTQTRSGYCPPRVPQPES